MRHKLAYCLFLLFFYSIAAAQKSAVKIKVKDEDNLNLPGASVAITPGKSGGVTDQNGELLLSDVPAGKYTLVISYIGYQRKEESISVNTGTTELTEILSANAVLNKEVVVMGDRLKGQSKALNQQKNSGNITNIISADQMGRFPDANIGDAIKRVPGITMQNDQGEARNIVIRGMGPEFNSVTFNGERIPSAEGDNRRVQMDLIPTDMVQTVEVNKTLTADMDADAIGGSVNLVTRSAPNGLRLSGTVAGGFNPVRNNGFIGTANFIVGNRFANDKIGFIVNGSYNRNVFGSDNVESVWSKDANGKLFVSDHDVRVYNEMRIRRSIAATIDFKLSPLHTISITGSYNWRDDKENRFRLRHRYRGDANDPDPAELIYDGSGNITGYSNGEVLRQTKGGLDNGRNESRRLEDQRVRSLAVKGSHLFGKLKADWSVQYAKASEKRPNERYFAMGRRGITITQDISSNEFPLLTDATELTGYTRLSELTEQFQDQYERDLNAKLNFELPLSIINSQKGTLKFGARIRAKKKVRDNNFFSYSPVTSFGNISLLPLLDKTNTGFYPGSKYIAGQFIDPKYLGGLDFKNASLFEETDEPAEYLAGNYEATETITAGFAELNQHFTDKFSARVGLRIEHTAINYTGNIVENEEDFKGVAKLKNGYTDVLPSINLRYAATDNFIIKAAWTNALARPKYYDLVPYFNINPNDLILSAGNPTLEPVRSSNLDLMAERYFKSVGIISGGLFFKKIDKFFYSYIDKNYTTSKFASDFPNVNNPIGTGETWEFTQRRNGDGATLWGFEAAIQRQFDFLPGFWKGFGIYVNYTYTHSKAQGIYDGSGNLVRSNVKLPGAAPHIFNTSLSYENKKIVARLSANFTSSYVDDSDDAGYNADAFFDRYYSKQFFLDANASYAFTKKIRLFAEANNLTNQPLRYYQGVKERTAQLEYYGPRFNAGIKFDLTK
ncbi:MAG: TonB-dependent receptor [Ferruginibacter sp.]